MSLFARLGIDVPDCPKIAIVWAALAIGIVVVSLALREEKQILVASCRAIFDTLRLAVRFIPHDVCPQVPTGILERKSKLPRYADEILRLQPFRRRRPN